jgi:broad specificity phosphatase PhoE
MTRFIMIRHGFSVANSEKRFAGHMDFPLTDIGKKQAEKCAEALKNVKIDAIYASDLKRAYETAVPVARALGLEIIPHKGLREIYAGDWEGRSFDELCEKYSENYKIWREDNGRARCDGGESTAELYARVTGTLAEIAKEHEGETVCIATHATPIRAVNTASRGFEAERMGEVTWTANASISVFEYEAGAFKAIEISNTDHLGELRTGFPSNV